MDTPLLVVDPDPQVRAELSALLALRGCRVETASDGQEALRTLERFRPAMVLLEMRLPVLDGWAVARELQRRKVHVPVVVMGPAEEASAWAQEIHAAAFLPKPVEVSRLLACVRIPDDGNATDVA